MFLKHAFLGMQWDLEKADVVILPIAYDSLSSYGCGARFGAHAVIYASTQLEFFERKLGNIGEKMRIHTKDEFIPSKEPSKAVEEIAYECKKIIESKKKLVVVGGDHSATIGVLRALDKCTVLHIDAHADLRKEYEGTRFSHACALREASKKHRLVQVGVRSLSEEESQYIEENGIPVFYGNEWEEKEVVKKLGKKVYVTLDIDALECGIAPSTGTPEPGGISWEKINALIEEISTKKVVGFDVMEVAAHSLTDKTAYTAAKLIFNMIARFWYKHK